jgi:hypothetical protein
MGAQGAQQPITAGSGQFHDCRFHHLGGSGLDLADAHGCAVEGCLFHDISGSGIQIGIFSDPMTTTDHNNTGPGHLGALRRPSHFPQ